MGGQAKPSGLAVLCAQGGSSPDATGLFEKPTARRDLEKTACVANPDHWTLDRSRDSVANLVMANRKGRLSPLDPCLKLAFQVKELFSDCVGRDAWAELTQNKTQRNLYSSRVSSQEWLTQGWFRLFFFSNFLHHTQPLP